MKQRGVFKRYNASAFFIVFQSSANYINNNVFKRQKGKNKQTKTQLHHGPLFELTVGSYQTVKTADDKKEKLKVAVLLNFGLHEPLQNYENSISPMPRL